MVPLKSRCLALGDVNYERNASRQRIGVLDTDEFGWDKARRHLSKETALLDENLVPIAAVGANEELLP